MFSRTVLSLFTTTLSNHYNSSMNNFGKHYHRRFFCASFSCFFPGQISETTSSYFSEDALPHNNKNMLFNFSPRIQLNFRKDIFFPPCSKLPQTNAFHSKGKTLRKNPIKTLFQKTSSYFLTQFHKIFSLTPFFPAPPP